MGCEEDGIFQRVWIVSRSSFSWFAGFDVSTIMISHENVVDVVLQGPLW